jgi:TP901 family phage tail tape measure protein
MDGRNEQTFVMLTVESIKMGAKPKEWLKDGIKGTITITGFRLEKGLIQRIRERFLDIKNIEVNVGAKFSQTQIRTAWANATRNLSLNISDVGIKVSASDIKKAKQEVAKLQTGMQNSITSKGSNQAGLKNLIGIGKDDMEVAYNTLNKVKKEFKGFNASLDMKSIFVDGNQELKSFTVSLKNAKGEAKALNFEVAKGADNSRVATAKSIRELDAQEKKTKELLIARKQLREVIGQAYVGGKLGQDDVTSLNQGITKAKTLDEINQLKKKMSLQQQEHADFKNIAQQKMKIYNDLKKAQSIYGTNANVEKVGKLTDKNIEAYSATLYGMGRNQRNQARESITEVNEAISKLGLNNGFDKARNKILAMRYEFDAVRQQLIAFNGEAKTSQSDEIFKRLSQGAKVSAVDVERVTAELRLMRQERDRARAGVKAGERDIGVTNKLKNIGFEQGNDASIQNATQAYAKSLPQGQLYSFKKGVNDLNQTVYEFSTKTMDKHNKSWKITRYQMNGATGDVNKLGEAMQRLSNRDLSQVQQMMIAIGRTATWGIATTAIYGTINAFRNMYTEILNVDKAMTEWKRVLDSDTNFDNMLDDAIGKAEELGNTVQEVTDIMTNFAKQGFEGDGLMAMTEASQIFTNISDLDANEASEYITSITKAYGIAEEEAIRVVDSINEVDNQFSVSSKQLAEGLSRVAGSAVSVGVSMNEVIGDITAIGQITREAGSTIGRSLKTIYTRTLSSGGESALEAIGVATRDMNGEFLKVGDILDDVSGKWSTLTTEQQNNTAMALAGRDHIARFNILMQQQDEAIGAVEASMNSYGSAINENINFQQSLEARQNRLKNAFTEMSLVLGEAFLTPAFINAVEVVGNLIKGFAKIVDTVGLLPTLIAPVGALLAVWWQISNKTVLTFGGLVSMTTTWIAKLTTAQGKLAQTLNTMKAMEATANRGALVGGTTSNGKYNVERNAPKGVNLGSAPVVISRESTNNLGKTTTAMGQLTKASQGATLALAGVKAGLRGLLSATGVGIAIVAVTAGIEWMVKKFAEAKQEAEAFDQRMSAMGQTLVQNKAEVDTATQAYYELSEQENLNAEETKRLAEAKDMLSQLFPNLIIGYDSEGKAILANNEHMKASIELAKEKARYDKLEENKGLIKDIDKDKKKIKELKKELETLTTPQGYSDTTSSNDSVRKAFQDEAKAKEKITNINNQIAESNRKIETTSRMVLNNTVLTSDAYQSLDGNMQSVVANAFASLDLEDKKLVALSENKAVIDSTIQSISKMSDMDLSTDKYLSSSPEQRKAMEAEIKTIAKKMNLERNELSLKIQKGKATDDEILQHQILGSSVQGVNGMIQNYLLSLEASGVSMEEMADSTEQSVDSFQVQSEILGQAIAQGELYNALTDTMINGTQEQRLKLEELAEQYYELINAEELSAGQRLQLAEITEQLGIAEGFTRDEQYKRVNALMAVKDAHDILFQIEQQYTNASMSMNQKLTRTELENASIVLEAMNAKLQALKTYLKTAQDMIQADDANWEEYAVRGQKAFNQTIEVSSNIDAQIAKVESLTAKASGDFNIQLREGGTLADKKMKEADEARAKAQEKANKEQEKATFIANKYALAIERINTTQEKMNKQLARYASHSLGYRKTIETRIKLLKQELKLMVDQRNEMQRQIKTGKLVNYGVSDSAYTTANGGSSSTGKSTSYSTYSGVLGGKLKGTESMFAKYGKKYGVDPALAMAIAQWETGRGTSKMVNQKNNVGGMYDSRNKTFFTFDSIEQGIESMIRNLQKNYISQGLKTIAQIQKKYAPTTGATNDPTGLNNNWTRGVNSMLNEVKKGAKSGKVTISSPSGNVGTGVRVPAGWNGPITAPYAQNRSYGKHEAIDIDGYKGQRLDSNVNGTVVHAGGANNSIGIPTQYGKTVVIKAGSYYHIYAHLDGISVKSGQKVGIGQQIGVIGNTGNVIASGGGDGSHLHYEVRSKLGRWGQNLVNPSSFVNKARQKQKTFQYTTGGGGGVQVGGGGTYVGDGAQEKANSAQAFQDARMNVEQQQQAIYQKESEMYQLMMDWFQSLTEQMDRAISRRQQDTARKKGLQEIYQQGWTAWDRLQSNIINSTKATFNEQKKSIDALMKQRRRKDLTPAMKDFLDDKIAEMRVQMEETSRAIYEEWFNWLNGNMALYDYRQGINDSNAQFYQGKTQGYSNWTQVYRDNTMKSSNMTRASMKEEQNRLKYLEREYASTGKYSFNQKSQIQAMIKASRNKVQEYENQLKDIAVQLVQSRIAEFDRGMADAMRVQSNRLRSYDTSISRLDQEDSVGYLKGLTPLIGSKDTALKAQLKLQQQMSDEYYKQLKNLKWGTEAYEELRQKWIDSQEAVKDLTDAIYDNQQALKDAQKEASASIVESLKAMFENMRDAELKALDDASKAKEKEHRKELERLDELLEKEEEAGQKRIETIEKQRDSYNRMIDDRIKGMNREREAETHQKSMTKLYEQEAELKNKISVLALDDSFEAKKRREELMKELKDLQEQISETQDEWDFNKQVEGIEDGREVANEEYDKAIEKENKYLEELRKSVEAQREALDDEMEKFNETLETKREAINKYYDDIANHQIEWNNMQKELIDGNFATVNEYLEKLNSGASDAFKDLLTEFPSDFKNLGTSITDTLTNLGQVMKVNILRNLADMEALMAQLSQSVDGNTGSKPIDVVPNKVNPTAMISLSTAGASNVVANAGSVNQFGDISLSFPNVTDSVNVPDIVDAIMRDLQKKYGIGM